MVNTVILKSFRSKLVISDIFTISLLLWWLFALCIASNFVFDPIRIRLAEKLRKTCKWYKRIDRLPVKELQIFAAIKAALYQINYWVTWEPAFPPTRTQTRSRRGSTATSKSLRDPARCTEPTSQTTHTHTHTTSRHNKMSLFQQIHVSRSFLSWP